MELDLFLDLIKDANPMMEYEIEKMLRDVQQLPESLVSHAYSVGTTRKRPAVLVRLKNKFLVKFAPPRQNHLPIPKDIWG